METPSSNAGAGPESAHSSLIRALSANDPSALVSPEYRGLIRAAQRDYHEFIVKPNAAQEFDETRAPGPLGSLLRAAAMIVGWPETDEATRTLVRENPQVFGSVDLVEGASENVRRVAGVVFTALQSVLRSRHDGEAAGLSTASLALIPTAGPGDAWAKDLFRGLGSDEDLARRGYALLDELWSADISPPPSAPSPSQPSDPKAGTGKAVALACLRSPPGGRVKLAVINASLEQHGLEPRGQVYVSRLVEDGFKIRMPENDVDGYELSHGEG